MFKRSSCLLIGFNSACVFVICFSLLTLFLLVAAANGITPEEVFFNNPFFNQPDTVFASPQSLPPEFDEIDIPPGSFTWPLSDHSRITSVYGWRIHPIYGDKRFHHGIDIAAPSGTEVINAAPGRVISSGYYGSYGNLVVIDHTDFGYTGLCTYYGHLKEILVKKGDRIKNRRVIGTVGNTGLSTGPHLHWEVRFEGISFDPLMVVE